jgi:hypothetical protein
MGADIVGYRYQADRYCPSCILRAMGKVQQQPQRFGLSVEHCLDMISDDYGINREDESSYDSIEFPKVIPRAMLRECGVCDGRTVVNDQYELHRPCTACDATGIGERCGNCRAILGES